MFKDKLKKLKEEKEITQQELADKIFVTRSAVAKWEQGRGIPNPESMKLLSEFFNIQEEELMNREDTIEVAYHFEESSQQERKRAIITLSILLLGIMTFFIILAIDKYRQTERIYQDQFFSSKVLKEYSLMQLSQVDVEGSSMSTSFDTYYAQVSSDFDIEYYARVVFDYLMNSPYISFVGFDIDRTTVTYDGTDSRYIAKSTHLEDYHIGSYYIFYYLDDLDPDRSLKSEVHFKRLSLSFHGDYGYVGVGDEIFNFSMHLRQTSHDIYNYFFFDEFYEPTILTMTNDNILDYFDIEVIYETYFRDYFAIAFQYKLYFIHAHIEIDLVVKYGSQTFIGTLNIKKGYDWSTYYFFDVDTTGWDKDLIEIISYDVIGGEMWIIN